MCVIPRVSPLMHACRARCMNNGSHISLSRRTNSPRSPHQHHPPPSHTTICRTEIVPLSLQKNPDPGNTRSNTFAGTIDPNAKRPYCTTQRLLRPTPPRPRLCCLCGQGWDVERGPINLCDPPRIRHVLQSSARGDRSCSMLQCVAMCCSVLQRACLCVRV